MIDSTENLKRQASWTEPASFERSGNDKSARTSYRARIQSLCGSELLEVETALKQAVRSNYSQINQISGQAAALGGKRLRPMLTLLASRAMLTNDQPALSHRQHDDLLAICCSVELVHAASLVHDDIMDNADLRRGIPTVGRLTGNSTAVLLGDYLFTKAYDLAARARTNFAARRIANAATKLCEGEIRQQLAAGHWELSVREYRSLLVEKTGALTAACCELGGWVARCSAEQRRSLHRYGTQLGLAFQIYDDWLDYWGSDAVGKTLGTDLLGGKVTLPLIRLLKQAQPATRKELHGLLTHIHQHPSESQQHNERLRRALLESDASDYTLSIARSCAEEAIRCLEPIADSDAKECLVDIARYSVDREL